MRDKAGESGVTMAGVVRHCFLLGFMLALAQLPSARCNADLGN